MYSLCCVVWMKSMFFVWNEEVGSFLDTISHVCCWERWSPIGIVWWGGGERRGLKWVSGGGCRVCRGSGDRRSGERRQRDGSRDQRMGPLEQGTAGSWGSHVSAEEGERGERGESFFPYSLWVMLWVMLWLILVEKPWLDLTLDQTLMQVVTYDIKRGSSTDRRMCGWTSPAIFRTLSGCYKALGEDVNRYPANISLNISHLLGPLGALWIVVSREKHHISEQVKHFLFQWQVKKFLKVLVCGSWRGGEMCWAHQCYRLHYVMVLHSK